MACDHKQLRCTDNRYFCLLCGAETVPPDVDDKREGQEEKHVETQKTGRKRKVKNTVD